MIDSIDLVERNAGAEDWSIDAKAIAKAVGPEYLEHVRRSVVTSTTARSSIRISSNIDLGSLLRHASCRLSINRLKNA